ncbi:MAG: Na+/H+ antiporter NhaA [Eggerthellaceae bacterium]|nr:Na+/H+ antiporter NhaA [Eggerthellaceae bacterium]
MLQGLEFNDGFVPPVKPSPTNPDPHRIFIKEVQGHQRRLHRIIHFTHSSTKAAGIMLLAAIVALIVANTSAHEPFLEFWHTYVTIGFGDHLASMSLAHIINDIFMAIFFLLVGLEIKYEFTVGELTNIRQAALPIIAAFGGVLAPIVIYLVFNGGNPETMHGWGIPTATDIAFALGILALLGNRVPSGVRVFLSTLAVADDIIAILVIAVFYGQSPSFVWLAAAAFVFIILVFMNRSHVYSIAYYLIIGGVLWLCVFMSGVHSTIAGVLLAFTIPSGSDVNVRSFLSWSRDRMREASAVFDASAPISTQGEYMSTVGRISNVARQVIPPATRLEKKIYPWVYFLILPLFALTNADVTFLQGDLGARLTSSVTLGVFFGLVVGKPAGIMLFSWLTIKLKIASLPENVDWLHMFGAAILGGVGFTMAIFVANLAFADPAFVAEAKLGILMASFVAGVAGFFVLFVKARAAEKSGVTYISMKDGNDETLQTYEAEMAREAEDLIAFMGSPELVDKVESMQVSRSGMRDIILQFTSGFAEGVQHAYDVDGNRQAWERDARWGDWEPNYRD